MWLLRLFLTLVLLAALVVVAVNNHTEVAVDLFGKDFLAVPLYVVLFGAALAGLLIGLGFTAVREVQLRSRLKKSDKQRKVLETEIQGLRAAPLEGLDTPTAPGSTNLPQERP